MDKDRYIIDDKLLDDDWSPSTYKIITKDKTFKTHHIYLSEHIENNFSYVNLLDVLRTAQEKDDIYLYVANYGGSVSSGFQIINAMKECKSGVNVIVDAPCYSMGAIIAVAGKNMRMNPGTFLMFHNYSTTEMGKGLEVRDSINHFYDYFHRHLKTLTFPFLSKKELALLKEDKDVYVSHDDEDLKKRIERHFNA